MSLGYPSSIIYFIYHSNNAILFINYIGIYIVNTTNMRAKREEKKNGGGRWRGDGGERWREEMEGREEGGERKGRRRRGGHGSRCQHTSLTPLTEAN
jgi:hypothetical protein